MFFLGLSWVFTRVLKGFWPMLGIPGLARPRRPCWVRTWTTKENNNVGVVLFLNREPLNLLYGFDSFFGSLPNFGASMFSLFLILRATFYRHDEVLHHTTSQTLCLSLACCIWKTTIFLQSCPICPASRREKPRKIRKTLIPTRTRCLTGKLKSWTKLLK